MKQYLQLLQDIKDRGTHKPAARANMPSTTSLFGYQFRHNLQDGFPLLTTKTVNFRHIVTELLWFLKGDTNIKYLIDNGCNIWNQDAYNYYSKQFDIYNRGSNPKLTFEEFVELVKSGTTSKYFFEDPSTNYSLGDCGYQYGKLWREWESTDKEEYEFDSKTPENKSIDQIQDLISGLKNNPMSRRHIITAWNPATLDKMALNACHCLVQFNCRPITYLNSDKVLKEFDLRPSEVDEFVEKNDFPKYYLDCQMYQRSADVFLGVPYNIASYALLTHILAEICNMQVGDFVHTFGDVHIYENHMEQVDLQLSRKERPLPTLTYGSGFDSLVEDFQDEFISLNDVISQLQPDLFHVKNYDPQGRIKAKLSTGLI